MTESINHFVRVDQAWSYNLIGGLKEQVEIDMHVIDDIFSKTAAYIVARHSFHVSKDATQYNQFMNQLAEHMAGRYMDWRYFNYFFNTLFITISPALGQITQRIKTINTIVTKAGDIEGFILCT